MHLLLCAATEFEFAPAKCFFQKNPLLNHKLFFLTTHAGLLPAAYNISKYLSTNKPDLIIQAGIGGSLEENIRLGETFAIVSDCVGDSGVAEKEGFKSLFELNLEDANSQPWKEGKLINPYFELLDNTSLPLAEGITVNEISTSKKRISFYKEKWKAQIESLEGAALHYICLQENIPFLQIRSVSNYAGERDKAKWKLQESIANLNNEVQRILSDVTASYEQ